MAIKSGEWKTEWSRTLRTFEKSNEASAKKFKIAAKKNWWDSNKRDDFTRALDDLDKIYSKITKSTQGRTWNDKALTLFEKACQKAEKTGNDYIAVLDKLVAKEKKEQAKNKGLGDEYVNSVKIIKKDIKAITTGAIAHYMEQRLDYERKSKGDADGIKVLKVEKAKLLASVKEASVNLQKARQNSSAFSEMLRGGNLKSFADLLRKTPMLDRKVGSALAAEVDKVNKFEFPPLVPATFTERELAIHNGTTSFTTAERKALDDKIEKNRMASVKLPTEALTKVIKATAAAMN